LSLSKTTKIALVMQSMMGNVEEDVLMQAIAWIINGVDEERIDWNGLMQEITNGETDEQL